MDTEYTAVEKQAFLESLTPIKLEEKINVGERIYYRADYIPQYVSLHNAVLGSDVKDVIVTRITKKYVYAKRPYAGSEAMPYERDGKTLCRSTLPASQRWTRL